MTPERWQQIKSLLDAWDDIAPEERASWLDQACKGDPELRAEVESYLAYEDDLEALETPPSPEPLIEALAPFDEAEAGQLIGPYRLERLLGRGGMGAVYLAHREAEFEQRVALKLVRSGFESPDTLERFHNERQILANLEHPNIARLLDGGTSEGRSYFVMELIDGQPIDAYCEAHRLTVRDRIRLFLRLCDALAFAHRNLVLHLDLKPSNILITQDGIPKLLDFGIGKLLRRGRETRQEEGTATSRPMTLTYASPEQLDGAPLSTSSDLYSLGVLLYELLTGRLPCGAYAESQPALAYAICHQQPVKPSTAVRRFETIGFAENRKELRPADVAQTRERSPAALARRLRGDLDAILLRTLNKDPDQRYASVEQLALDLRRYLDELPVDARRGSLAYRTFKYVRRNRWRLSVAAGVLGLIFAFTVALSNQLRHTERQRQRSARLSEFLVDLFRAAEPDRAGREPSVRGLVDIGRQRLETELTEEPETRALLLGTLGKVYYRLGHFEDAKQTQQAALDALQRELGGDHIDIAKMLNDLSAIAFDQGDYRQAEAYSRQSIAMRERLKGDEVLTPPRNNLAAILMLRGKLEEAEAIYRDTITLRRAALGDRHLKIAITQRNLATVHTLRGEFEAAEPLLQESLDIRIEHLGRESASVSKVLAALGRVAHARGELDVAERYFLESLEIGRRLLGHHHLSVAILEGDFARLLVERGELSTASVLFDRALSALTAIKPEGDWTRADLESAYGGYLAAVGRLEEAEVCLREGARVLEAVRGPDVLYTRQAKQRLEAFELRGQESEAGDE
ncbi:MAG: serine/threonine-protein kinase [Acidobacteriota bacterium]